MIRKILLAIILLSPLAVYPFLRENEVHSFIDTSHPTPSHSLSQQERLAIACLAIVPGQSFPTALPWGPMQQVGDYTEYLEEKAKTEPLEFLQMCLNRYECEVRGYRCIMYKKERVKGVYGPEEELLVHFREKPFSVRMDWVKGERKACRALYIDGENDSLLNVRIGRLIVGGKVVFEGMVLPKKVDASDVMETSRFPITQFGVYLGAVDTLKYMRKAKERDKLFLQYCGIEKIEKTGNRPCFKFIRTPYDPPEADDVNELTIFIDQETLMQVGSILKDSHGELIAEYFFRDIEVKSDFDPNVFKLKSKGGTF